MELTEQSQDLNSDASRITRSAPADFGQAAEPVRRAGHPVHRRGTGVPAALTSDTGAAVSQSGRVLVPGRGLG